ncbi:MAG TPA: hypothetical protein VGB93_05435, partial [Methylovirgula sp.]
MELRWLGWRHLTAVMGLAVAGSFCWVAEASAHVKWFCFYNVAGQPRGLENVLCPNFEMLLLTAFTLLLFGYIVEWSVVGTALLAALNRV